MSDGDAFRAQATRVYQTVRVLLAVGTVAVTGLGWLVGGWIGLVIAGGLAAVVAVALLLVATLFWALSQDGA